MDFRGLKRWVGLIGENVELPGGGGKVLSLWNISP